MAPTRCSEAYGNFRDTRKVVIGRVGASDSFRARLVREMKSSPEQAALSTVKNSLRVNREEISLT